MTAVSTETLPAGKLTRDNIGMQVTIPCLRETLRVHAIHLEKQRVVLYGPFADYRGLELRPDTPVEVTP